MLEYYLRVREGGRESKRERAREREREREEERERERERERQEREAQIPLHSVACTNSTYLLQIIHVTCVSVFIITH